MRHFASQIRSAQTVLKIQLLELALPGENTAGETKATSSICELIIYFLKFLSIICMHNINLSIFYQVENSKNKRLLKHNCTKISTYNWCSKRFRLTANLCQEVINY